MNQQADPKTSSLLAYSRLHAALQQFGQPPSELDAKQMAEVERLSAISVELNSRLLSRPEAAGVHIPSNAVEASLKEIRSRFPDERSFTTTLEANGLDKQGLRLALEQQLRIEAIIEQLTHQEAEVSDGELEQIYQENIERFTLAESRSTRHILITLNEDFADNSRAAVTQRSEQIHAELSEHPERFSTLAERHSECPTAMQGGLLGRVVPGTLYPELESVLFSLQEGEISPPIESPLGVHILLCERINPAGPVPLEELADKLRDQLSNRKRKLALKKLLG